MDDKKTAAIDNCPNCGSLLKKTNDSEYTCPNGDYKLTIKRSTELKMDEHDKNRQYKYYASPELGKLAMEFGYKEYCEDCYTIEAIYPDGDETKGLIPVEGSEPSPNWFGLIPDYSLFYCIRPTLAELQNWLIEKHDCFATAELYRLNSDELVFKSDIWFHIRKGIRHYSCPATIGEFAFESYPDALNMSLMIAITKLENSN